MTNQWKERILGLRYRNAAEDDFEFVGLVDLAQDKCDFETCKTLMATFVTDEDFGVQESVNRVLSTANPEDRQKALMEELSRLLNDAPGWAEVLVETEIRFHLEALEKTIERTPPVLKASLDRILEKDSFREQFPNLKF